MSKFARHMNNLKEMTDKISRRAKADPKGYAQQAGQGIRIRYILGKCETQYANCFTGSAIREEVVLKFGIHHNWERRGEAPNIEMSERIILNPYTAKRLANVLRQAISEYERRFGSPEQVIAQAEKEAEAAVIH